MKTGEELVARIVRSDKKNLMLERPMRVMGCMIEDSQDPNGSVQREMVYMNDYLEHTSVQKIAVPRDVIQNILPPNKNILAAYIQTKERFDRADQLHENMSKMMEQAFGEEPPDESDVHDLQGNIKDIISGMIDSILNSYDMAQEEQKQHGNFHEEISDEDWNEEDVDKTREDWGNDWTDWSPDPKDY
jgi:hypothetical protein